MSHYYIISTLAQKLQGLDQLKKRLFRQNKRQTNKLTKPHT